MLVSGLHRHPKEHMPWLLSLGRQQARLKAETSRQRRSAEEMERQQADRWSRRYRRAWHPEDQ